MFVAQWQIFKIETDTNATGQTSGIEFGIPNFTVMLELNTSTTYDNDASDLNFYTNPANSLTNWSRMIINQDGSIGINNTNPGYTLVLMEIFILLEIYIKILICLHHILIPMLMYY